ncbi:MAG: tetratricopeptide repeat protein [Planctomycetes bacterium]|nr:tetratricopeptide repeat protein [Planctomycetota bacterium]
MSEIDGQTPDKMSDLAEDIKIPEELKKRAQGLFSKAKEVAYALQYDYAIEMYLDGLAAWPTALEEGHKPLREIALRRLSDGGKKSGFGDKSKFKSLPGKSPRENMLKAEYLLSKDPNNPSHMTNMIKGALDGDFKKTAFWMADILLLCNIKAKKPSLDTYKLLMKAYSQLDEYAWAVKACTMARQMKPGDNELNEAMRDLSAQATMQEGKYDDDDGDFRGSIQDREGQEELQDQELSMRSQKKQAEMIANARREYLAEPIHPGKVNALVDINCEKEDKEQEDEAFDILEKAYAESDQFHFKKRAGELKIKQNNRIARNYKKKLQKDAKNPELKKKVQKAQNMSLQTEIDHYQLCVENYPTDQSMKFEYAKRLVRAKKYDDAIPLFQEARSNPRHRLGAVSQIGQCWFYKKWYTDAVDSFNEALEMVESQEGQLAKELRYNLGRAYEADGNFEEALNSFRKVAQIDFNYLDVRQRVDELRKKQKEG